MVTGSLARRYAKAVFEIGEASRATSTRSAPTSAPSPKAMKESAELVTVADEPGDPPRATAARSSTRCCSASAPSR